MYALEGGPRLVRAVSVHIATMHMQFFWGKQPVLYHMAK